MIPIRDNIPARTTPFVNYTIIGICALVFLLQLAEPRGEGSLVERYGMIPARVLHPDQPVMVPDPRNPEKKVERYIRRTPFGDRVIEREVVVPGKRPAAEAAVPPWLTLLTCIFLHGGWLHFLGNMWFLFIFGDNVEDRFGHLGFVVFYLGCGVAASAAHLASAPGSTVPTIGASGAIAGVMGAYFLLYPRAMVLTVVPIFFFLHMVVLPAPIFLGVWFLIQFFQGAMIAAGASGVAWWAHIGGFLAGMGVVWGLQQAGKLRPPVTTVRPQTERVGHYRVRRHNDPWM